MYNITGRGVERLTDLIDKDIFTPETISEDLARQQRLLEVLEYLNYEGNRSYNFEEIVEILRGQRFPIEGTDKQWRQALNSLVRNGYVEED